ncbi:MAG: putative bifunctional diguanylate cyclase/phosphodiesterase [Acidimicrobiia bacterium]
MRWKGSRHAYRRTLIVSAVALALGLAGGIVTTAIVFLALGLYCPIAIVRGVKLWQPVRRPWVLWAVAMSCFELAAILAFLLPSFIGHEPSYPSIAEVVNAVGYVFAIAAMHSLVRSRSHHRDPTNLMDALIAVGGIGVVWWLWVIVPYASDTTVSALARGTDATFSLLWLVLGSFTARFAIGSAARNRAYYFVVGAMVSGFAAEITLVAWGGAQEGFPLFLNVVCAACVYVCLTAAALHPSMRSLSDPEVVAVGRMSRKRFLFLTTSSLLVPATLAVKWQGSMLELIGIEAGWLLLTLLTLRRLAGLASTQEDLAATERLLHDAAEELASCTTRPQILEAANRALAALVARDGPHWTATVESMGGQMVVRSSLALSSEAPTVLELTPGEVEQLAHGVAITHEGQNGARPIVVAPLQIEGDGTGALAVELTRWQLLTRDRIKSLARAVALAWNSTVTIEEEQRRRSEQRFRALIEQSNDLVIVLDDARRPLFVSPAVGRLLGFDPHGFDVFEHVYPTDRTALGAALDDASNSRRDPGGRAVRLVHAQGYVRWFEISAADFTSDREIGGVVLTARDVTDRKHAEDRVVASEARFRSLVQHSSDLVVLLDADTNVHYVSPSIIPVLGYELGSVNDTPLFELVHPEDTPAFVQLLGTIEPGTTRMMELRLQSASAEWHVFEATFTDLRHDPNIEGIVLNGHDVTTRKVLEGDLWHRALHDGLTGLGNRIVLKERLEAAIKSPCVDGLVHALLFIDLDDFKTVNDSLGHAAGDFLLQVAAHRIDASVGREATAARLGGDEFAVLLEQVTHEETEAIAGRVLDSMVDPITVDGVSISSTVSIGIAYYSGEDKDADVMLRDADAAMYYAKSRGKGRFEVFDHAMHAHALERLHLKGMLKGVVERQELRTFYQPIVDMHSGRILGFESLMRWEHPSRGLVPPIAFIPLAEETGEIVEMGLWLMRDSLRQLAEWQREFLHVQPLGMSLNLSGRQLDDDRFPGELAAALSAEGLNPADVTIELTESRPITSPEAIARLHRIADLGVHLAADDFGSGEASYAALQSHPYTVVKVDRSLVQGLGTGAHERAVAQLRSISDLAKNLGYRTVVEGVEDASQLQVLASLGFDRAQGFYFGRPVPKEAATALLVQTADAVPQESAKLRRSA